MDNQKSENKPKFLKIKEVAQLTGLSEQCLRNWDDQGVFKCHHRSEKGGYRYYTREQVDEYLEKSKRQVKVVGYCRASDSKSNDIARQSSVISNYISTRDVDLSNFVIISDVADGITMGKGLTDLIKDISDNLVKELVVEDRTRLSLVDFNLIQLVAKAHNCKVTVLNELPRVSLNDIVKDAIKVVDVLDKNLQLSSKEELKKLLCDIVDGL